MNKSKQYVTQIRNRDLTSGFELEPSMEHPIIRGFTSHLENSALVKKYILDPNESNLEKLNQAFKIYIFAIRFTKYLSSLIGNSRIDYVRRTMKDEERELVIFDKPISEEEDKTLGEMLTSAYHGDDLPQVTVNPDIFQSQLNNEWLYEGFSKLTPKQKLVITLAYSSRARDNEIALLLHVTQQAVSKTRKTSLQKLKRCLPVDSRP